MILDLEYAIIGGTTKAATSSLFTYFSAHPQINGSTIKETRFFLDEDYPLPRKKHNEINEANYLTYFKNYSKQKINIEATPDYLYSINTPDRILKELGGNIKIIFILRNPVDRVVSWYRFAKQTNEIKDISFQQFIDLQKFDRKGRQIERVLEQGKYSMFLKSFYEKFDEKNIKILFYEEIVSNEKEIMYDLSKFLGINPDFYTTYSFNKVNVTVDVNQNFSHKLYTTYRRIKRKIREFSHDKGIHKVLAYLNRKIEKFYFKKNKKNEAPINIDPESLKYISKFYMNENSELEKLIGKKIPWKI